MAKTRDRDHRAEWLKWRNLTDAELISALAAAKLGSDPVAARTLIEYFYQRIHSGERYNERVLLEYLDHAFGKIIEDKQSADHAFGFKLPRGKYKREDNTERDVKAAAYIVLLMRKNWTWQDAKGEAANLLFPDDKGDKAVEAAYKRYKDALRYVPAKTLMALLPPGTSVISRDMTG